MSCIKSPNGTTDETPNMNFGYTRWASHNMLSVGWLFLREVELPCIKITNSGKKYHTAKYIPCWVVCKDITDTEAILFLKLKHVTVTTLSLKLFYTINKNTFRNAENALYHHYKIWFYILRIRNTPMLR
jgi:hypothetical protein